MLESKKKESIQPDTQDIELFNVSGGFCDSIDDSKWPDALSPTFSRTIKGFMEQCKDPSLKLLNILSIGLELEEDC